MTRTGLPYFCGPIWTILYSSRKKRGVLGKRVLLGQKQPIASAQWTGMPFDWFSSYGVVLG
jgi:hypothetical protein